jgi:hypothetical protein
MRSGVSGRMRGPHSVGTQSPPLVARAEGGHAVTRTRARYLLIAGAMIAGAWTLVAVVSTSQWYFFRLS